MYNYVYPDCDGCKYEDSNDIKTHMQFCNHCSRSHTDEFEQSMDKDMYVRKENSYV